jgi:DNA-binding XRE family transcriptional regulator
MKTQKSSTISLDDFIDKQFGPHGTSKRDNFEEGYRAFKIGILLQEARKQRGLTQEQLANKVGTTKSYISKIENDIKEARLSTIQKIVEIGLGGKLELSIKL